MIIRRLHRLHGFSTDTGALDEIRTVYHSLLSDLARLSLTFLNL